MLRFVWCAVFLLVVGLSSQAFAHKNGIATPSCSGCHTGGKTPTVTLTADPINPAVGQTVTLTISVSQTNGPAAGFYITSDFPDQGMFKVIETGTATTAAGVTHSMPRTGSGGVTTFKVGWSSAVATGAQFSVHALSANADGTSNGDGEGEAHLGLACGCVGTTYYLDRDLDGYGTSDPTFISRKDCTQPPYYVPVAGDCDDTDGAIHPGAVELRNGKDDNCNGTVDEGFGSAGPVGSAGSAALPASGGSAGSMSSVGKSGAGGAPAAPGIGGSTAGNSSGQSPEEPSQTAAGCALRSVAKRARESTPWPLFLQTLALVILLVRRRRALRTAD